MNDTDYDAFVREFARLSAALERFKPSSDESTARADAYFHVLKKFSLSDVIGKADRWLENETKFPKPVEWAMQIVKKRVDYRKMALTETIEHKRAESLGYEDPPCGCQSCVEAGVQERPLRYVPDQHADDDTDIKAEDAWGRLVTTGRWIHGWELFRWYEARGAFWNHCAELGLLDPPTKKKRDRVPFEQQLESLFKKKPGLT